MNTANDPSLHDLLIKPTPWWKTAMDKALSACALLLLAPVFLIVALAVKLTSPGPVFFRQVRAGLGGQPFHMLKFRSMVVGAEAKRDELLEFNERSGPAFKMTNDPRVTPVGAFLRKWSLDELPQLINVLRGDMSLVGPRPLYISEEKAMHQWHRLRRSVKPGITCLWQITSRDEADFDNWMRLDAQYIRNRSFWLDVKILLLTLPAVVSKKGAK
jgi:exopolysaccharide biosynthesis polyprenyl glycosylphosphotransferase